MYRLCEYLAYCAGIEQASIAPLPTLGPPGVAAVACLFPLRKKYKIMIRFSDNPLANLQERVARLEAEVALLKQRNVTHNVTRNVTSDVTRNGNAERQRRYRERKKAKTV